MNVNTVKFGNVEVNDDKIFNFVSPILGYNDLKSFAIIENSDKSVFKWLQSIEAPEVAFAVTMPGLWRIDYTFVLPDEAEEKLGIDSIDDLIALNVVVIPKNEPQKATINLLAPILLNIKNKKAGQFILSDNKLLVEQPLITAKGDK